LINPKVTGTPTNPAHNPHPTNPRKKKKKNKKQKKRKNYRAVADPDAETQKSETFRTMFT
jgi:hypothetical protein